MTYWELSRERLNAVDLDQLRRNFQLDPGYQREGNLWSRERRQLFIDSLINGFDVPPLYLHSLRPPLITDSAVRTYAVIDGRQRLEALWAFFDGSLVLHEDAYVFREQPPDADDTVSDIGGLSIDDLRTRRPDVYSRFVHYEFSVTVVETDDTSLIEEMFFRLNEGVPLSPAEKRHRGALLRAYLADLLSGRGALSILRPKNRRRVHEDLLLRLLYLEKRREEDIPFPDMKKADLDAFAASFSPRPGIADSDDELHARQAELDRLGEKVMAVITAMKDIFDDSDARLSGTSWFISYYLLMRLMAEHGTQLTRDSLDQFWVQVRGLTGREEDLMSPDQLQAIEVTGPLPASTTGSYFKQRVEFIVRYLNGEVDLEATPRTVVVSE